MDIEYANANGVFVGEAFQTMSQQLVPLSEPKGFVLHIEGRT
jgi:hypothetical protein